MLLIAADHVYYNSNKNCPNLYTAKITCFQWELAQSSEMNGCSITAEYFINHIPLGIGIVQAKAGSTWTLRMALASHEAAGLRGEHEDFIRGTQPKKRIHKKYSGKSLCNSTRFILKAPQYFPNWLAPHDMYHSLNEQDLLWMTLRDVRSSSASNYIFRKRYKNKTFSQFVMA